MNTMTEYPHKYITAILSILLVSSANSASLTEEPADTVKSHELNEVVFTESREIYKDDHVVLFLSNANRKFGTNALDAISSLNRFQTSLNATALTSWDRSSVFILINGVPSTAIELRSYRSSDIKNVEYYQEAPPQYRIYTTGPIVNVIIKRKHDRLYSGYFNAQNAVNTAFGDNQADLSYTDSLNQFRVGYYLSYRNTKHNESIRQFDYSPTLKTRYEDTQNYKGEYHKWNASYQRYQGNHLFNARVYYITDQGSEPTHGIGTIMDHTGIYSGLSARNTRSRANTGAVDLYYNYNTDNGKIFAINIVNTFGSSRSDSYRSLSFASPYDYMDYNVGTNVRNSTYSLIADALFAKPMLGGRFQASAQYEYNSLSQKAQDNRYRPSSHSGMASAGFYWSKNAFYFYPILALDMDEISNGITMSNIEVNPFAQISAGWRPSGKLKGVSANLSLAYMNIAPQLNQITESYTYLDQWMISTGNPDLRPYHHSYAILYLNYFHPNGRDYIGLKIVPQYASKLINPVIVPDDGYIIRQLQNLPYYIKNQVYLSGAWHPFQWLEISPYAELYTYRTKTPNQALQHNYIRYGGNITFSFDNWEATLAANSPTRDYYGDFVSRGSAQYAAIVQYKYRSWSFGAEYHYSGVNEYRKSNVGEFSYLDRTDRKQSRYLCQLTATYSFSIGRARNHAQKILNNSSSETGLNSEQKAKQ